MANNYHKKKELSLVFQIDMIASQIEKQPVQWQYYQGQH
jgi:hypothetical protein